MKKGIIKEVSIEAIALKRFIESKPEMTFLNYRELSGVIGKDIQKHRGYLYTAFRLIANESNRVFTCIKGEGYKLCKNSEIVDKSRTGFGKIRRCSTRHKRILLHADYATLPQEKKNESNMILSAYGAISFSMREKTLKRLQDNVNSCAMPLPSYKTLEALKA